MNNIDAVTAFRIEAAILAGGACFLTLVVAIICMVFIVSSKRRE